MGLGCSQLKGLGLSWLRSAHAAIHAITSTCHQQQWQPSDAPLHTCMLPGSASPDDPSATLAPKPISRCMADEWGWGQGGVRVGLGLGASWGKRHRRLSRPSCSLL